MSERVVGIYAYRDNKTNEIVYIGKDSNIDKQVRHKGHLKPSQYNTQQINRILQNNPNRYNYEVLKKGEFNQNWLNALEILYIRYYQPKFNFTAGGDGCIGRIPWNKGKTMSEEYKQKLSESHKGYKHSEETKRKISEANKGHKVSEETRRKISESNKGKLKGKNHPMYGKHHSDETKKRMSLSHSGVNNWKYGDYKKFARIIKYGKYKNKQKYCIMKDGKAIKSSFYPYKLLKWFTKTYPTEILQIKL